MLKVKVITSLAAGFILCLLQPAAGSCGGLQGDVVFVLDASGSVGSSDFQTMLQFVNDLVDDFDIGTDLVRVGVVKFASSVYPEIDLHDHSDKTALKNTILGIAYTAGGTYTAGALSYMTTFMFTTSNGGRNDIPDVGIIITDGASWSYSATATAASAARAANITLFSIGIGTGVLELNAIASDPDSDHVFTVASFSGLSSIESSFQTKACTSTVFAGNLTVVSTGVSESGGWSHSQTGAVVGGVVVGLAVLGVGVAGVVIYSKVLAGKTAISTLQSAATDPEAVAQNRQCGQPSTQDTHLPGLVDVPASQIRPIDTRWPARLPPLVRA